MRKLIPFTIKGPFIKSVSVLGHFFDQKMMKILKWEVANFKMLVLGAQKELGAQILTAVRYFSNFENLMWILRNLMWILSHFGINIK